MKEVLVLLAAPLWTYMAGRSLLSFYRQRGQLKSNYRGLPVSPALGPALLLGYLFVAAVSLWLDGGETLIWLSAGTVAVGASFYGLWDDLLEEKTSGFRGHFGAGLRGRVTAGLLKTVTALLVAAIFAGTMPRPLPGRLAALLLVLLSANGLNLLDRRPGRALKVFFAVALTILVFAAPQGGALRLLLPLLAITLAVAPLDLNAEGMLGDCGANLLGALLGVAAALYLSPVVQAGLLLFWTAVHALAEFVSLSSLIERVPPLDYLDRLGRSREKFPREAKE